jgi:predicted NBD/HSP70 family sugar kinase
LNKQKMSAKALHYKKNVIKELYFRPLISCAELSLIINKSLPVTTKILDDLIEDGIVVENGYAPSTGGRRPAMYSLKADSLYMVSVAMDQFVTRIAIMDMQNKMVTGIEKFELPLPKNKDALPELTKRIGQVIEQSGVPKGKIAGIGIGMPGFVDVRKGVNYSFLPSSSSITNTISHALKLPVFIDNDSSLIALAELRFGKARNKANAMVINMGWGIGLGIISHGELFRGHNGFAGEFSHIPLFTNGKLCSCGKRGCLETETSMLVVIEKAIKGLAAGQVSSLHQLSATHYEASFEAIVKGAHEGDQFVVSLLSEAGYNIGRGVAILITLFNPELVILSGRGAAAGKIWLAPIQQALNEHCIPRLFANTTIEVSSLGYDAELTGAAALVMENYTNVTNEKSIGTDALKEDVGY